MAESLGSAVLELDADLSPLDRGIDRAERRVHTGMTRMRADVASFRAGVDQLRRRVVAFAREKFTINLDTDRSLRSLIRFQGGLADSRVQLGLFSTTLRALPAVLGVVTPMVASLGAGVALLGVSAAGAVVGLGALGVAALALIPPFALLIGGVIERFSATSEIAGSAANRLAREANALKLAFRQAVRPASIKVLEALSGLLHRLRPVVAGLRGELTEFGSSVARAVRRLGDEFSSPRWRAFFSQLTRSAAKVTPLVTDIFIELARHARTVASAAMPLLLDKLADLRDLLADIDLGSTRELRADIRGLLSHFSEWVRLGKELGRVLGGFFRATGSQAKSFVSFLADGAERLADWVESARGQREIREFFEAVTPVVQRLLPVLGKLAVLAANFGAVTAPAVVIFLDGFKAVIEIANRALVAIRGLDPVLQTIIGGFLILSGPIKVVTAGFRLLAGIVGTVARVATTLWRVLGGARAVFIAVRVGVVAVLALFGPLVAAVAGAITVAALLVTQWGHVKTAVGAVADAFADAAKFVATQVGRFFKGARDVADAIVDGLTSLPARVVGAARWLFDQFKKGVEQQLTAWGNIGRWVLDKLRDGVKSAGDFLADAASWLWRSLKRQVEQTLNAYLNIGRWLLDKVRDGLKNAGDFLADVASWLWRKLKEQVEAQLQGIFNIGRWIADKVRDGIKSAGEFVGDAAGWLKDKLFEQVRAQIGGLKNIGEWIVDKIVDGIKSVPGMLKNAAEWVRDKIVGAIKDFFGISSPSRVMQRIGGHIIDGLARGVIGTARNLPKVIGSIFGSLPKAAAAAVKSGVVDLASLPVRGLEKLAGLGSDILSGIFGGDDGDGGGAGSLAGRFKQVTGLARAFGLVVTSGFRPGDPGFHGQNRARDYAGPAGQMLGFARLVSTLFGPRLLELIHTPLGFSVDNGRRTAPFAQADHFDHVHVALEHGGTVLRDSLAMVGERGRELVHLPAGATVRSNRDTERLLRGASGGDGPLVNIEEMNVLEPFSEERLARKLGFAIEHGGPVGETA